MFLTNYVALDSVVVDLDSPNAITVRDKKCSAKDEQPDIHHKRSIKLTALYLMALIDNGLRLGTLFVEETSTSSKQNRNDMLVDPPP